MAVISPLSPSFDGVQVVFGAADNADQIAFDRSRILLVNNGSGVSIDVTLHMHAAVLGETVPDKVISVPAGEIYQIQLGQQEVDPATGFIELTYSATASVTRAVLQPPS